MYNVDSPSMFTILQKVAAENKINLIKDHIQICKPYKKNETLINSYIDEFESEMVTYYLKESEDFMVNLFVNALKEDTDRSWYRKMLEERLNQKRSVKWRD